MVNYGCAYDQDCSRAITIHEAAQFWELAGGNPAYTVKMVAIAMAESCLDPYAVSKSCAVGIWQIVAGNVISDRPSVQALFSPLMSAQWAVRLSNNGDNITAWDVAYAAGEGLVRLDYLHDLQPGSTAYELVAVVANTLGTSGGPGFTEPGVSLAADIEAAPQANAATLPPAPQPQPDVPPPYIAPTVVLPRLYEFDDDFDGWDNVIRYYKRDLPTYVAFDDELNIILSTMTGDVP